MSANMQKVQQVAADWVTRQGSGAWTETEQAAFDAWIEESTAHKVAFLRLDAAWNEIVRLKALKAGIAHEDIPARGVLTETFFPYHADRVTNEPAGAEANRPMTSRMNVRRQLIAASALIVIGMGSYLTLTGVLNGQSYTTQVGATENLSLSDGSRATLNTDTRVRVTMKERERIVEMERGEAYFNVARDPTRPFVVKVGDRRIVAVGTAFSVRMGNTPGAVQVAVSEGSVRVEQPNPVLLRAGMIAEVRRAAVKVHEPAAKEVDQLLSWRQGFITFRETPLAEAVAEFNRYNKRKIVIQDEGIADFRVGGSFKPTNTDAFLWMLQKGFSIAVEYRDDQILLSTR